MAHQPRDDGGILERGVGAGTWVPCADHVRGRLRRILTKVGGRNARKMRKNWGKIRTPMAYP